MARLAVTRDRTISVLEQQPLPEHGRQCRGNFREWLAKRLCQGMGAGGICRLGTQQTVKRQMHRAGKRSKSLGSKQ